VLLERMRSGEIEREALDGMRARMASCLVLSATLLSYRVLRADDVRLRSNES